jgi:hypothetical protein
VPQLAQIAQGWTLRSRARDAELVIFKFLLAPPMLLKHHFETVHLDWLTLVLLLPEVVKHLGAFVDPILVVSEVGQRI